VAAFCFTRSWFFEIARVLVRFDQVARIIVRKLDHLPSGNQRTILARS
jgi:hypothetical protein